MDQPAKKVDWKIGLIPKDAPNPSEPLKASVQELEGVIANPSSLNPQPLEENNELDTVPRYNANIPYTPQPTVYTSNDQILMEAIKIAVKNGWKDYGLFANDAVTIGMEAEAVVNGMKKRKAKVEELLFNKDFCKALWGEREVGQSYEGNTGGRNQFPVVKKEGWEGHLKELVVSDNPMEYLKDNVPKG